MVTIEATRGSGQSGTALFKGVAETWASKVISFAINTMGFGDTAGFVLYCCEVHPHNMEGKTHKRGGKDLISDLIGDTEDRKPKYGDD